jgi:hypothetical protein
MTGLALAVAFPALGAWAQSAAVATHTTLFAETRDLAGRTRATVQVAVAGQDGQPATGTVVLSDGSRQISGLSLSSSGTGAFVVDLAAGVHSLRASYQGDSTHQASVSSTAAVHALTTGVPDFGISIAPATLSLTAGQTGDVKVSIAPENAAALSAPMFITLSCSNFPDQSACTFTPSTVEIEPGATTAVTSDMVLTTQSQSGKLVLPGRSSANATALAILFPGILALGGLAWGARRRRFLSRIALMSMLALIAIGSATGCNPQYYYKNHGPVPNQPTPTGSYTLKVTGQYSNGVTATTHSANLALTVK